MARKAILFTHEPWGVPPALEAACERLAFDLETRPAPADPQALRETPGPEPVLALVPAIEEDFLGVKIAQLAALGPAPRAVVLYAPAMPSAELLCLAVREPVDDVIRLEGLAADVLDAHLARVARLLQQRAAEAEGDESAAETVSLRRRTERLERADARQRERLLALSGTAVRLATGELRFSERAPRLLIVAASQTQAETAAEFAKRIGFETDHASSAAEALALLPERPPQAILADGTLADMGAREFAAAARKALGARPVVIVAWSSNPEAEDLLTAPDSAIDDFVLKSATNEGRGLLAAALLGALR